MDQAFFAAFTLVAFGAGASAAAAFNLSSLMRALRLRMACACGSCAMVFNLGREDKAAIRAHCI